jgi:AcrR family transcriptional regulator
MWHVVRRIVIRAHWGLKAPASRYDDDVTSDDVAAAADAERNPRQRAIDATRTLAEQGGYEAVQIRDIVRLTGLSSATIYRYFSSKDHLIAATHLDFIWALREDTADLDGGTAPDRVATLLHRTCTALAASPNLGKAFVFALGSSDLNIRALRGAQDAVAAEMVKKALGDDVVDADEFILLLGLAWEGALYSWAHGELALDEVDVLLQRVARVLLAGAAVLREPSAAGA